NRLKLVPVMGLTLTKAADWLDNSKLDFSPSNQIILTDILKAVDGYSKNNPIGGKMKFSEPLVWDSTVKFEDFKKTERFPETESENTLQLDELLTVTKQESEVAHVECHSFDMLQLVLDACRSKKTAEVRACLEGNSDPVSKILGNRYACNTEDDVEFYKQAEEDLQGEDITYEEFETKKVVLKMAMEFHNLDVRMLRTVQGLMSKDSRLSPRLVEAEFDCLKELSGSEDEQPLRDIEPVPCYVHVFSNGYRAPNFRQLQGDIAYFLVYLKDTDVICVTAGTKGWFVNKGYSKDTNDVDFERRSDLYGSLFALLRERSRHFRERTSRKSGDGETAADEAADGAEKPDQEGDADQQAAREEAEERKKDPTLRWVSLGTSEQQSQERRSARQPQSAAAAAQQSDESDSESGTDEEEDAVERRHESNADLPSEYWQIGKFVRYLKGGNQTSTIISLCALRDFQLNTEVCQLAIRDVGGLEVLLNLLETEENRCKIGSLKILKEISQNPQIRRAIADLGGLQTLVNILKEPSKDLKCLAAETIANVAKFRRARRIVRQHGGIRKLVSLLDCPALNGPTSPEIERDIEVARCGALALWSLSNSTKNKRAMKRAGVIPLLGKLLKSRHEDMLIPVVGTLQECASEPDYRVAIRTEGMVEDLVKNLKSDNAELQMHCASTIFKCAEEEETRDLVRSYDGLEPMVGLLNKTDNKELLSAATGAIWKCSMSSKNIRKFQELNVIEKLVRLLSDQPEEVLVNVVGALGEMAAEKENRHAIRKAGGIGPLVQLLTGTNQALLVNTTRAVGRCAQEKENMAIIDRMDGVRLLWSLLKNPNPEVQASAAYAICPCIDNVNDAGEMVRSYVGGLELIVHLLRSDNIKVLAAICAAVASIAKDEENLAVLTDHGVIPLLAGLTRTQDEELKRHLSEAIACCCAWGNNRIVFGKEGAVAPLVSYLRVKDPKVHRSTARALHELSRHPDNCITMHECGVVRHLLGLVGSDDEALQLAASGCIANIRRLAMANEKSRQSSKARGGGNGGANGKAVAAK
ncbi:hypothetical protein BOX15_Mlig020657g3, partial [Macrostomum lignano]